MATENQVIRCKISESVIKVTISDGGVIDKIWELLDAYIIEEDLSSQIDGSKITFTTTYNIYNSRIKVFVNGVKEKQTIVGTNTVTLATAPIIGDQLFVEYLKNG